MSIRLLPTYEEFIDHLIEKATPQEILEFEPSEEAQDYVQDLIDRHHEGKLTPEEMTLIEQALQFERLMTILKARALAALKDA